MSEKIKPALAETRERIERLLGWNEDGEGTRGCIREELTYCLAHLEDIERGADELSAKLAAQLAGHGKTAKEATDNLLRAMKAEEREAKLRERIEQLVNAFFYSEWVPNFELRDALAANAAPAGVVCHECAVREPQAAERLTGELQDAAPSGVTDSQRLDWLSRNIPFGAAVEWDDNDMFFIVHKGRHFGGDDETLRAAIDAAMKEGGAK